MTTLNDAFKQELTQEDDGYKSGIKSLNIPTLLRRAPWIYHISTSENLSFNLTTLLTTAKTTSSTLTLKTQKPQTCTPPFSISSLHEERPVRTGTLGSSLLHDRADLLHQYSTI